MNFTSVKFCTEAINTKQLKSTAFLYQFLTSQCNNKKARPTKTNQTKVTHVNIHQYCNKFTATEKIANHFWLAKASEYIPAMSKKKERRIHPSEVSLLQRFHP